MEFTDIKNFSRNLVRETQQIRFYDGQFFLLATTNIFHERQHAYLGPYSSLSSICERISASFNDHYPLNRQLLGKGMDNCEIEVHFRRWQTFLSSLYRPHQLWWPPNLSNGYQGLLYWEYMSRNVKQTSQVSLLSSLIMFQAITKIFLSYAWLVV